jgi:CheY-like chemotaxis protein
MVEPLLAGRRSSRTTGPPSPPSRPTARQSAASGRSDRAPRPDRPRVVLLADDDPVVRQVVRLLIELQGDTVIEAEDGAQAVSVAAAHEGPIDLLLTDVMMPGLTGPQVCDRIRQQRPELPTLFISGYFPEAVFPDQRLPPRAAFLSKPFMPDELAESVDRLLDETSPPRPRQGSEQPLSAKPPVIRRAGSSSSDSR